MVGTSGDGCSLPSGGLILAPMSEPTRYSVVVPCFNSGPWIDELVRRVGETMAAVEGGHELILVNDGSPDAGTWPAIRKQAETVAWVRAVDLMANVGQFRALMCGLELAQGEFVITMDDDLQHPPEEIPKLIEAIESDPDLDAVIGAYTSKEHSSAAQPRNGGGLVDLRSGIRQAGGSQVHQLPHSAAHAGRRDQGEPHGSPSDGRAHPAVDHADPQCRGGASTTEPGS